MYYYNDCPLVRVFVIQWCVTHVLCGQYSDYRATDGHSIQEVLFGIPLGLKHNPSIVVQDLEDSDGSDGSDGSDQIDRSSSPSSSSSSSLSSSESSESDEDERNSIRNDERGNDDRKQQQLYNNRNDIDSSEEEGRGDDNRDENGNEENIQETSKVTDGIDIAKHRNENKLQQINNNKNELGSKEIAGKNEDGIKEENVDDVANVPDTSKSGTIISHQSGGAGEKGSWALPDTNKGTSTLSGVADDNGDKDESRPRGEDASDESRPRGEDDESRPRGEDDGRPRGENTAGGKKKWPKLVPKMFKSLVPEAKKNSTKHTITADSKKNNTKGQETVSKSNHGWPYFVPEVFKPLIPDTERNGTQAEDNSDTYKQNNNLSYTETYVMDQYMENLPYAQSMLTFGKAGEHEVEHTDASGGEKTQSADFNIPPDEITMQNGGAGYSSANESSGVGNNNKSPFKVNYSGMSATGSHGVDDKNKSPGKMKPPGKEGGEAAGDSHQQVPDNKPGKVKNKQDGNNKATETQSSGGGTVPKGQGSPKGDQYNRPPGNVPSVPD